MESSPSTETLVVLIAVINLLANALTKLAESVVRKIRGTDQPHVSLDRVQSDQIRETHKLVMRPDITGNPAVYGERLHAEFVAHAKDDALYQQKTDTILKAMVDDHKELRNDLRILIRSLAEQAGHLSRLAEKFTDLLTEVRSMRRGSDQ